jgi:energy-coupling factor transporter ATP-binding protein EcfA2
MLRDLTIQNYRAFKDFTVDGLARVNLLVGKNNCGKTSFLEAVYLLASRNNPFSLLELLYDRGEYTEISASPRVLAYDLGHFFHSSTLPLGLNGGDSEQLIRLRSRSERSLSLQIQASQRQDALATSTPFELKFTYAPESSDSTTNQDVISMPLQFDRSFRTDFLPSEKLPGPHQAMMVSNIRFTYLAKLWDSLTLTAGEDKVLEALRILAPSVERASFTSQATTAGSVLIKSKKLASPIPLSSLGDGMRRILALAILIVKAENAILIVDEIDTGLYHSTLTDVWHFVLETARRLNVQIFATTHSWDCVQAFQEALIQNPNLHNQAQMFRLEEHQGDIRAVRYDADELAIAVRQAIEVR